MDNENIEPIDENVESTEEQVEAEMLDSLQDSEVEEISEEAVKICQYCKHDFREVCQIHQKEMKPNDSCNRWELKYAC